MISAEKIDHFLQGHNPKQYVVGIECNNYSNVADLIIHDPNTGKKTIEKQRYTPFLYLKDFKKHGLSLYDNDAAKRDEAIKKFNVKIKTLVTDDDQGRVERLYNGYKYMVSIENGSYNKLLQFFKEGGIDLWAIRSYYNEAVEQYDEFYKRYEESINKIEAFEKKIKSEEIKLLAFDDKDDPELRKILLDKLNDGKTKGRKTDKSFTKRKNELIEKISTLKIELEEKRVEMQPLLEEKAYCEEKLDKIKPKRDCTFELPVVEQFMISTGIRLFKGYEHYNDLEKFYFDIETTGLDPRTSRVFLIGCKTNKGFRMILSPKLENDDDSERRMIKNFFYLYAERVQPAIIAGYNSENFDWDFLLKRARILNIGIDFNQIQTTISSDKQNKDQNLYVKKIEEKRSTIKLGNEKEYYQQKIIYGINNIDIWHSVRRAMAINSDIKEAGLKYISKFAKVAKPNRTYIEHDKIYRYWFENKHFVINSENSEYKVIPDEFQSDPETYLIDFNKKNNVSYELTVGRDLVTNYLQDDLDETEAVDNIYNESSFMMAKIVPSNFSRIVTVGGASVWNLIMTTWSFENQLAIPYSVKKRDFVGGLSRTYRLGRTKNILKSDFAGLYPSIQLAHDVFPRHDIQGALKGLLHYFRDTRNKYKSLAKTETDEKKQKFYDSKQLPIKILNNSMFGAFGSEYFNWSDYDKAEEITCRGRLYLRKMVKFFMNKGLNPVILDTDGVSLSVPDSYKLDFKFEIIKIDANTKELISCEAYPTYELAKSALESYMKLNPKKWKAKKGDIYVADGIELKLYLDESELEILFDELNKKVFKEDIKVINSGIMKVDNDGRWESCITVGRKNYANLEFNGNIKLVGNTIKSKSLPEYIEEFLNKALTMLLKGQGKEFIEYYYAYIADIYNKEIPLKKIASKKKVKLLPEDYKNRGKTKNGREKGKQVHMELVIKNDMNVNLGDTIYYINNGKKKGDSDSGINKETTDFNSYIIENKELEMNPEKKGDYNVPKYLYAFNTKIESLFVCFNEYVAENLLVDNPQDREYFTDADCELKSWTYDEYPFEKDDLDPIDELFIMDDREVDFWNKVCMNPHDIFDQFKVNDNKQLNIRYIEKFLEYKTKLTQKGLTLKRDINDLKEEEAAIIDQGEKICLYWQKNGKLELLKEI
jgi:DNA polymerase elongation subunit (family B)